MENSGLRIERDSLGEVKVPQDVLYGAQTARAVENFPISQMRLQRSFIRALGLIKAMAARVNGRLGHLNPQKAFAIESMALKIADGLHDSHFVVDVFQSGSGTSTNMNANEVIASLTGCHPNDEVNLGQSSNDVIPSALHLAAIETAVTRLLPAAKKLRQSLQAKSIEFDSAIKIGRTHLQDAVPIRLGQEFSGYAKQVEAGEERIAVALTGLHELPLGGTAVGTGLNAPAGFSTGVVAELRTHTGWSLHPAANHFEAQGARDGAVFLSAALRNYAIGLTKIANDIRWMASGPRCGLGEIRIPAVQPGSSIMPGKINPVIAESLLMVCAQVIGHDSAIAWCGASGNFELNTTIPLIAWNLLDSMELLAAATENFEARMVRGIEANENRMSELVERSLAMVTALVPAIGYDRAAELAKEAAATDRTIRSVVEEKSGLSQETIDRLLDPRLQTE